MEYEVLKEKRCLDIMFDIEYFLKYKSYIVRIKGREYKDVQSSDYGYTILFNLDPEKWKEEKGFDYKEYQFFPHQLSERTFDYLKSPITDIVGVEFDLVIADPNNNIKYISTIDFDEISEESKEAVKKCLERIPTLEEVVMVKRIDNVFDEVYTCTLKNGKLKLKKEQNGKSKFLGVGFSKLFMTVNYEYPSFRFDTDKFRLDIGTINRKEYPEIKQSSYMIDAVVYDKHEYYKVSKPILVSILWCKWAIKEYEREELTDILKYVDRIKEVYVAITHRSTYTMDVYLCTLDENGELVLSDNTYSETLGVDMKDCVRL